MSEDSDCDGAGVNACVVRGCLPDLKDVAHVFDSRLFPDRDAFVVQLSGNEHDALQLLALVDKLRAEELVALLMAETDLQRLRTLAQSKADSKGWQAVADVAGVVLGHISALRGKWDRSFYTPLLGNAAWRDLAATALSHFPGEAGAVTVDLWPLTEPLPIPEALLRFAHAAELSPSLSEFAQLRTKGAAANG
jgi:hypothetical protein